MFHELIYTRCRQGMDILKKGQPISSDGYKVYACTPSIMDDGVVDLPYFTNAVQTKLPCNDPSFMDDAYLYYTPDKGASFMLNFYPIPFDANAKGDYSHRPGNFVNHALAGDFSGLYPFEMFKDKDIWNAKTRGEAYYYENEPFALPPRNDVINPQGHYSYDEIGAFIADGRKEALARAVSFLISEYEVETENRKFLVFRDDSSEKIELWIAAIESAFSPRMASAIPFATRMDKFINANRYTVNQLGVYQVQMNLQDHNQQQRFRAMIIGVDERDKTNMNAARPLANSPFVLLDGKEKRAMFEGDTSDGYYKLITRFDDEHQQFCREFLQTFDIPSPTAKIFALYDVFIMLNKSSASNARTVAAALEKLSKYKASNTSKFREIYNSIDKDVPRFLQEDLSSALSIINWLQTSSRILGDSGAKERLSEIVCKVFIDLVFRKSDGTSTHAFWELIKRSEFDMDVAHVMTDMKTFKDNTSNLHGFNPSDAITFVTIYLESATLVGMMDQQNAKKIVGFGLEICYRNRDKTSVHEIVKTLSRGRNADTQDFLFSIAKSGDSGFAEFIIAYMIDTDDSVIVSDNAMGSFCKRLYSERLEHLAGAVLLRRLKRLNKISEFEQFIKTMGEMTCIGKKELMDVFEFIDKQIDVHGKNLSSLAELLQLDKPHGAVCKNSAHVYALDILTNKRGRLKLIDSLQVLINEGFPSIQSKEYIDAFTERILKSQLSKEEQIYMMQTLEHAPIGYFYTYAYDLCAVAAKQQEKWNTLISFAAKTGDEKIYDALVQVLVNSQQTEKSLGALEKLLSGKSAREYFSHTAENAWKIVHMQKSQSGIGKLFGLFKRGNDKGDQGQKK